MTAKKSAAPTETADRELTVSRVIDAPRERVWRAFADPAEIVKWWGPDGFTNRTAERSFKSGGEWRHVMIGPDGTEYANLAHYEEVAAPERIVFTNGGGKKGAPGLRMRTTITLKDLGDKTEVTIRHVFDTRRMRDDAVNVYRAAEGGRQTLARLAAQVETAPAFELNLERLIDATRERLWKAWTDPEQMKLWFAPRPLTLSVKTMDLRTGGAFDMTMHMPDGTKHAFSGRYAEVVALERIAWAGEFPDGPREQLRTTVEFVAEGNKTRVKVRHIFTVLTPETAPRAQGAEQGWTMTLDQLAETAEKA
jgi:uncharacterized protein YndB with AHSA1/START domain